MLELVRILFELVRIQRGGPHVGSPGLAMNGAGLNIVSALKEVSI